MNLYYLHVESEPGVRSSARTWLVFADSLFGAIASVPNECSVKAIEVQVGSAIDPRCVIETMSGPLSH